MAKWFALEWGNVKEINPSTKDGWKQPQGVGLSGESLGFEGLLPSRSPNSCREKTLEISNCVINWGVRIYRTLVWTPRKNKKKNCRQLKSFLFIFILLQITSHFAFLFIGQSSWQCGHLEWIIGSAHFTPQGHNMLMH